MKQMIKQKPVDSLRESIRLLEIKQAEEAKILKEQFSVTVESLKPVNLLKSSIKEMTSSADLKNNLFETVFSILGGYLSKKIMVNSKSGPFLKIAGAVLQFGVTTVLAQNAEKIRNYINNLIEKYLQPDPEELSEPNP
jgi:hypothetical protein